MFRDFIRHLFPRVVLRKNLTLTYTFCLGGLAFTTLLALILSGMLLLFHYEPAPERAYASVLLLERDVWGGMYIRNLHRLSSHCFLAFIFLHTVRVLLTGAYQHPRQLNWIIGSLLLALGLFAGYTGYLLPMDQLPTGQPRPAWNCSRLCRSVQSSMKSLFPTGWEARSRCYGSTSSI